MITKQDLLRVRKKALRLNVWYKILSRTERAIADLTLKCVERIRSSTLETAISDIINKILEALEGSFIANAEKIGREIAGKFKEIAEKWGYPYTSSWKYDKNFMIFLGVCSLNQ